MNKKSKTFSLLCIVIICFLLCCLSGMLIDNILNNTVWLRNTIFVISCFGIVWLLTTIYLKIFHKKDE